MQALSKTWTAQAHWLLAASAVAVAACSNAPPPSRGLAASCAQNDECESGDVCDTSIGQCVTPGADDGGIVGVDSGVKAKPDAGTVTHPAGDYCLSCQHDSDCGGAGNFCLPNANGAGTFCSTHCQQASDCPSDADCFHITGTNNQLLGNSCFPKTQNCPSDATVDAGTPPHDAGTPHDAGNPAPCTTDTWGSFAQNFFTMSCDYCHGHNFEGSLSSTTSQAGSIRPRISSGNMPQNTTLSSSDKSRILLWIKCGEPQ
jgi:hypothetical protein